MHPEIDAPRLGTEPRESIGAVARVDRVVGQPAGSHPYDLRIERFGPLLDLDPLLALRIRRVELDVFHLHLGHAERRGHADDIHRKTECPTQLRRLIHRAGVIPHLVGEDDDHHVAATRPLTKLLRHLRRLPDRQKRHLDPGIIDGNRADRLHHLMHVVGGVFRDDAHPFPERHHHVFEIGAGGHRTNLAELFEHPTHAVCDLIALRRQAHRAVEDPADNGRPSGERGLDLGRQMVHRPRCAGRADPPRALHDHGGISHLRRRDFIDRRDLDIAHEFILHLHRHDRHGGEYWCNRLRRFVPLLAVSANLLLRLLRNGDLLRLEGNLFLDRRRGLDHGEMADHRGRLGEPRQGQRQEHGHMDEKADQPGGRIAIEGSLLLPHPGLPLPSCRLQELHEQAPLQSQAIAPGIWCHEIPFYPIDQIARSGELTSENVPA